MKRKVYLFGAPGKVGGAATKIWDLLTLLREDFDLCLVLRHKRLLKDREIQEAVRESGVRVELEAKLPKRMEGIALEGEGWGELNQASLFCQPFPYSSSKQPLK